ncbi:MAG TPA: Hsp20/alpha crystallin family protein [Planctomycetota bacterium]|nr:Hsp20/alpha crystallin family protein [Planctomycetota bacterium]
MLPMVFQEMANKHRLSPFFSLLDEGAQGYLPALDVHETDDRYELRLDVPGVAKEDLKVRYENDALTVEGDRKSFHSGPGRGERWVGRFERTLSLPDGIDAEHIEANLENGVLTIVLPKAEAAKPRQITIQ